MSNNAIREIVWQLVSSIPKGRVASYGQIAAMAGYPSHARFVGSVLKDLPQNTTLPWYRVINAQGKLSFPVDSMNYKRQRLLLESERVVFVAQKISLKEYLWAIKIHLYKPSVI